jgi:hypothetical protein
MMRTQNCAVGCGVANEGAAVLRPYKGFIDLGTENTRFNGHQNGGVMPV